MNHQALAWLCTPLVGLAASGCYDLTFAPFQSRQPEPVAEPSVQWARQVTGAGEERANVDVFSTGDLAVAGSFSNKVTLGPGEEHELTLDAGDEDLDGFVALYQASGSVSWAQQVVGTDDHLYVNGVAAVKGGALAITGSFRSTATFGPGTQAARTLPAGPGQDLCVALFDHAGVVQWAKRDGSPGWDSGQVVAASARAPRRIVVGGQVAEAATFGDGMDTVVLEHHGGDPQAFIAAYREDDGALEWVCHSFGAATVNDLVVQDVGAHQLVYVTGSFSGETTTFRSATTSGGPEVELAAQGEGDTYLAAYLLDDGTLQWIEHTTGQGSSAGFALGALDDRTLVVAGNFEGKVDFDRDGDADLETDAPDVHLYLARYLAPELDEIASPEQGAQLDWLALAVSGGRRNSCGDLALYEDGSVLLAGTFGGPDGIFAGTSSDEVVLQSAGFDEGFVAFYEADGQLEWARRLGGAGLGDSVRRAAIPSAGSAILSGSFYHEMTFGEDAAGEPLLESEEGTDAFLLRLDLGQTTAAPE